MNPQIINCCIQELESKLCLYINVIFSLDTLDNESSNPQFLCSRTRVTDLYSNDLTLKEEKITIVFQPSLYKREYYYRMIFLNSFKVSYL